MKDLITEARALCDYSEKIINQLHTERLDYELEYMPLIETIQITSELCDALEKAQVEIERLREAQRWVPMSERFPTEKDADRLGFIIAHSDSMGQSTVCVWHHVLDDGVTSHWMPLPVAPEEGTEHERD